jgi:N-acetylglucosamine-6-phosphate deacetylase
MTIVAGAGIVAAGLAIDSPAWVELDDGFITALGAGPPAPGATVVADAVLVPGFVDLQVNGVGAVDFATGDVDAWRDALRALARHGVTACCPTLVSAPLDAYVEPLHVAATRLGDAHHDEAAVLGVHLEGPFLGGAPGAHVVEHLRPVDEPWLRRVLDTLPGVVRIVTLAPEADDGLRGTRLLHDAGVVVAVGHSTATYAETRAAADAGARLVTHLFNGMGPLHQRAPGIIGAALDPRVPLTPTMIGDLVHVHPALVAMVFAATRPILVSDAVATGVPYFDADVTAASGAAYLPDGTLTGAVSLLDTAVRNVIGLGVLPPSVFVAASIRPAARLGLDAPPGMLELDDRLRVQAVVRDGRTVYRREA